MVIVTLISFFEINSLLKFYLSLGFFANCGRSSPFLQYSTVSISLIVGEVRQFYSTLLIVGVVRQFWGKKVRRCLKFHRF